MEEKIEKIDYYSRLQEAARLGIGSAEISIIMLANICKSLNLLIDSHNEEVKKKKEKEPCPQNVSGFRWLKSSDFNSKERKGGKK